MAVRALDLRAEYDQAKQLSCGLFGAQLDDQTRRLKEAVAGLSVTELEWQLKPGLNTIGMLLAHIAVAEIYWMGVAPAGMKWGEESDRLMLEAMGIRGDDDGLPLPPDGIHPETLRGKALDEYSAMLDGARRVTHDVLSQWDDDTLAQTYRLGENDTSRAWTVYHVLEHMCGHFGQILMIRHLMKTVEDQHDART